MSTKADPDILIRRATDADKPGILAALETVFGSATALQAERSWDWQWRLDPRLQTPGYQGVVAECQGRIVGNTATIPAGLAIAGTQVSAWWLINGLVLTDFRGRGLAKGLLDHPAAGEIQLAKHISEPMRAVCQRIGFDALPATGTRHRRVSTRHRLGQILGRALGDLTGTLIDPLLGPAPRPELPVSIHEGDFDARFATLWEAARAAYPAICRRDPALLRWRYHQHPDADARVLTLDDAAGLRGYCVIRVFERPGRPRRRRGMILDLLTAPADAPAQRSLLAAALAELRRERVERVTCFHAGAGSGARLAELGFTPMAPGPAPPNPCWSADSRQLDRRSTRP